MLIVMRSAPAEEECIRVEEAVRAMGYAPVRVPGADGRMAVCVTGNRGPVDPTLLSRLPGVRRCIRVTRPYKLVSREVHRDDTVVEIGGVAVGGAEPVVIAGPGSVETEARTLTVARAAARAGVRVFRARLWAEGVRPYEFAGVGDEGLHTLARVREETGLPVLTEIVDPRSAERVAEVVDAVGIAARHMQNEALLEVAAGLVCPVILERGSWATIAEWLLAAESLRARGKRDVILCERGVRTGLERRTLLDLHSVAVVRQTSHLPVLVDPSRAVAERSRIRPLSRAALATGAAGLMIEVHNRPDTAYTDPGQTVDIPTLEGIFRDLEVAAAYEPLRP